MFTITLSFNSFSVYLVAADILVLLSYILYIFNKKRQLDRAVKKITDFVEQYFMNSGADVQTTCFKMKGGNRFIVLLQSPPLKQFRCSSVLENNLVTHIHDAIGITVEKIYWRFPISVNKELMAVAEKQGVEIDDTYFAGIGLEKDAQQYNVSEVSWDQYESPKPDK